MTPWPSCGKVAKVSEWGEPGLSVPVVLYFDDNYAGARGIRITAVHSYRLGVRLGHRPKSVPTQIYARTTRTLENAELYLVDCTIR